MTVAAGEKALESIYENTQQIHSATDGTRSDVVPSKTSINT